MSDQQAETPGESHLPPQERKSVINVPVTPDIRKDTYNDQPSKAERLRQGYFPPQPGTAKQQAVRQTAAPSPQQQKRNLKTGDGASPPLRNGADHTHRRVISATFTVPQLLQYDKDGQWKLEDRGHRSTLLNSFAYLSSSECPVDHTVVAWTGEIVQVSRDASPSPKTASPARAQLSGTATTGVGFGAVQVKIDGETTSDEIFISHREAEQLKQLLRRRRYGGRHQARAPIPLARLCRARAFAEHDMFALFHYKQRTPTAGRQEDERWNDYRRMNEAFADKICDEYQPGDVVMVHDYHLALLPAILRQRKPDMRVSFYLASPFPTSELVRCLHRRNEVLEGMLGGDIIAFQARHYAQHFANSCARILGLDATCERVATPQGRTVTIAILPEGIDVASVTALAFTPAVDAKCVELRALYGNRKLIFGCDPPDSLGGVDKKLQAFARLLETHTEWKDKVVLVQTCSRPAAEHANEDDEAKYTNKVNSLVAAINQVHGSLGGFAPVSMHSQSLSREEYFALLRLADAALITSAREGMSTTGLEYVACQQRNDKDNDGKDDGADDGGGAPPGQLIISEFSGTASSLEEALQINPWDVAGVAERIDEALTMSPERRREVHRAVYGRVRERDVRYWVNDLLRLLEANAQIAGSCYSAALHHRYMCGTQRPWSNSGDPGRMVYDRNQIKALYTMSDVILCRDVQYKVRTVTVGSPTISSTTSNTFIHDFITSNEMVRGNSRAVYPAVAGGHVEQGRINSITAPTRVTGPRGYTGNSCTPVCSGRGTPSIVLQAQPQELVEARHGAVSQSNAMGHVEMETGLLYESLVNQISTCRHGKPYASAEVLLRFFRASEEGGKRAT
ncbi:CAZyme family GT20 [Purpureocillium lilacinum]|uniref:CAZyme family GT20 n=1 Tax=Purpureocillium lilacinum TaxID=33203 RepID=A0ABR0BFJ6_PURLI|nr:CAZyme family GT20 [Purpureocillium lilacinum]